MTWTRYKEEENPKVFRWFQNEKGDIISVVDSDVPNQAEIRYIVDGTRKTIPGSKELILKNTDDDLIAKVERTISRNTIPPQQNKNMNIRIIKKSNLYKKKNLRPKIVKVRASKRAISYKRSLPQTGKRKSLILDRARRALPPGKRVSSTGRIYWETRRNRSDIRGKWI